MDSMCMLNLLHSMGLDICVAHMNFGLRGASSDLDSKLVRTACDALGLPYFEKSVALKATLGADGSGLQEAARHERYAWFEQLRCCEGFDAICTGHHQDDAIETFFINLIRGTGIKGLTGIPFRRDHIIRPMMCFTRAEIQGLIATMEIPYREDESNSGDAYLRNRIRHHMIPLCIAERDNFIQVMRNNQTRWTDEYALMEAYLEELSHKLCTLQRGVLQIHLSELLKSPAPALVLLHLLRERGFNRNQCQQIIGDDATSGSKYLSDTHELVLHRNVIQVYPHGHFIQEQFSLKPGESIDLPDGVLKTTYADHADLSDDQNTEYIDASKLAKSLVVRHWRSGDYFIPLGSSGRQKLQDFFTNAKLSPAAKANTWVLLSGDAIVWLTGLRIDNRFKVTSDTTRVMQLKWLPTP
jgi:tRNA(Ile)-lysidine synthase